VLIGWVERLFAKPIILHEVDGFHYVPKKHRLFIYRNPWTLSKANFT